MTRLVPYRSLSQLGADSALMAAALTAGALAARLLTDQAQMLVTPLAVGGSILATILLSEVLANWRARRRGAEMITRDEYTRRNLLERASRPAWESITSTSALASFVITLMLLAISRVEQWPRVPIATAIGGVVGMICGWYIWSYARSYADANARLQGPQQRVAVTPFAQIAMRHYAGYALGLAFAMIAATLVHDRQIAIGTIPTAFFVGKILSDNLTPPVHYGTSLQPATSIAQILRGVVFAIFWWGIPFGALLMLVSHATNPNVRATVVWVSFLAPSLGAIVFFLFISLIIRVTRGRSRPPQ